MFPVSLSLVDRFPREVMSVAPSPRGCVVALRGEFDVATSPWLAEILAAVVASTDDADVIIDVRAVGFVDSAAVRVFERASAFLAERHRRLTVAGSSPLTARVLDACGASGLLDAVAPPDAAVR